LSHVFPPAAAGRPDGLSIDFGSTNTAAMVHWPDGQVRPLLFDGAPVLASAVYAEPDGALLTGIDALRSATVAPERFEPNPKRRIDDGLVLLGDRELMTVELIAAVLARVAHEVTTAYGALPPTIVLTCPAGWAAPRRRVLVDAAHRAGLGQVDLLEEPVAAAVRLARLGESVWQAGSVIVVYDLGGGTCDVSVIRLNEAGPAVLAIGGRTDIGGLDLDAVVVELAGTVCRPRDPTAWQTLMQPTTSADRRLRRTLWDDARSAKEQLSRHATAYLHIPKMEIDLHITREELEDLARPLLERSVEATVATIRRGGVDRDGIATVLLVGGSSRIPLVATLLHQRLGIAPTVMEQPETVVAEGAALAVANAGQSVVGGRSVVGGAAPTYAEAVPSVAVDEPDLWPELVVEPEWLPDPPSQTYLSRIRPQVWSLCLAGAAQVLCAAATWTLIRAFPYPKSEEPTIKFLADVMIAAAYLTVAGIGVVALRGFRSLDNRSRLGLLGSWLIVMAGLAMGTIIILGRHYHVPGPATLTIAAISTGFLLMGSIFAIIALRPLGLGGWLAGTGFAGFMLFGVVAVVAPVGLGVPLLAWLLRRAARRAEAATPDAAGSFTPEPLTS